MGWHNPGFIYHDVTYDAYLDRIMRWLDTPDPASLDAAADRAADYTPVDELPGAPRHRQQTPRPPSETGPGVPSATPSAASPGALGERDTKEAA